MFIFNPCLELVYKHQCNKVAGCAEKTCVADEELCSLHQEEGSPRAICAEWKSLCSDCESRFVSKPYTPRVKHLKCCFISLYLLTIIKNEKQTEISPWTLFQDSGFQFSQLAVNHFLSKTTRLCDSPLWGSVSLFNRVWRIFITLQKHGKNSLFLKKKRILFENKSGKRGVCILVEVQYSMATMLLLTLVGCFLQTAKPHNLMAYHLLCTWQFPSLSSH